MGGWMFFPSGNFRKNWNLDDLLEDLPSLGSLPSRDEWYEHVPETRERLQGHTLGFFCGIGKVPGKMPPGHADLPAYPMSVFVSELTIMPACWTSKDIQTVPAVFPDEYRIVNAVNYPLVITVTGTLPDRPPAFRVFGSYCFFPPPYVMTQQIQQNL